MNRRIVLTLTLALLLVVGNTSGQKETQNDSKVEAEITKIVRDYYEPGLDPMRRPYWIFMLTKASISAFGMDTRNSNSTKASGHSQMKTFLRYVNQSSDSVYEFALKLDRAA